MSANVNTMMYVGRETPWHGLGVSVETAPTSADAIRMAGLDWTVKQKKLVTIDGMEIPDRLANIRSDTNAYLGTVSNRYRIVQNEDAFSFTDGIIGGDVRYETAGVLGKGETIWLLAKLPETELVGDKTDPYLCFTNAHDGTGAVRACVTPIRVVCQNTLNVALRTANRAWSTKHTGDMTLKMREARKSLELAGEYLDTLSEAAMKYANTEIRRDEIDKILEELFPIADTATDREKANKTAAKQELLVCYFAPDIEKFRGTAWGLINAASDMATHNAPRRMTKNYRSNNWGRVIKGHPMIDGMVSAIDHVVKSRVTV